MKKKPTTRSEIKMKVKRYCKSMYSMCQRNILRSFPLISSADVLAASPAQMACNAVVLQQILLAAVCVYARMHTHTICFLEDRNCREGAAMT